MSRRRRDDERGAWQGMFTKDIRLYLIPMLGSDAAFSLCMIIALLARQLPFMDVQTPRVHLDQHTFHSTFIQGRDKGLVPWLSWMVWASNDKLGEREHKLDHVIDQVRGLSQTCVLHPLLTSAPPDVWGARSIASASDCSVEEDALNTLWWHDTQDVSGSCSRLLQSECDVFRDTKQYGGVLDALTPQHWDTSCKQLARPSTATMPPRSFCRSNSLLNSILETAQHPVLNDVSLSQAVLSDNADGVQLNDEEEWLEECSSGSSPDWNREKDDDYCVPVPDSTTHYTSSSIVELLEDVDLLEPSHTWFDDDEEVYSEYSDVESSPASSSMQYDETKELQRAWCVSSPQFRLPLDESYTHEADSSGSEHSSCSSNSPRHRQFSEGTTVSSSDLSRDSALPQSNVESEQDEPPARGPGRRSRDDQLARQFDLPVSAARIAAMPLVEMNHIMQSSHLTEHQQTVMRKIRRRGKNKLAARTCRKRKSNQA